MSDAPERIWRVKPWSLSQHKHGLASWPIEEQAGPGATEYTRADLHRAEVEAAVKRALEAAAQAANNTGTCLMPNGQFLSERCAAHIRALASDPDALRRIVEGEE